MKTIAIIINEAVYNINHAIQHFIIEQKPSSSIEFFGFTATDEMFVQFKGGTGYVYQGVPKHVSVAARKAESIGSFIGKNIVGKYPSVKLKFVGVVKEPAADTQNLPI